MNWEEYFAGVQAINPILEDRQNFIIFSYPPVFENDTKIDD